MSARPSVHASTEVPIPTQVKKNTWLLAITQAINGAGMQLVPTFGAIQVVMLLGNAAFAGLATSLMGLARVMTSYFVGGMTDRRGRKAGLYLGLWLAMVGALLIGTATLLGSLALFCVGALVFGSGVGAVQQMRVAAADMYPPSRRAEGLSLVAMGSLLGAAISPVLVFVAERLGLTLGMNQIALAWLMVPLLILPGFWLVRSIRPDPKQMALELGRYYPASALSSNAQALENIEKADLARVRVAAILSAVTVQGQMVMMMAMTPLALKALDCSLSQISFSVALHVMGMFAFSWPIGRLADRLGRQPVILAGLAVAGLGALLVGMGQGYWVISAGTFLVGLGWSGTFLSANTMLADVTPATRRGQAIGVLELWSNAAGVSLPILGGLLVEGFDLHTLGFVGALLVLVPLYQVLRVQEPKPGDYR
ncbi:MFS transporter [Meiothermus hypogaeus]|uniref:MFS transporter n=2 Tax=Meiothermus hypogaeus TaxID=884155 RepID=A0A511QYU9_9DEIN|nr:MFS transporter [Meiothermus hypogaeus]RIH79113.1 Riboflavin transporter RfnT [Meiothermus hypogaeus]GEM82187.1 MFS transporter [Meiothermus hypogaeus NBRC 106114]